MIQETRLLKGANKRIITLKTHAHPAGCLFEDTAADGKAYPPVDSDIQTDVCVVGGGITGLTTAIELTERGYDVTLIEASRIGGGATGRCGGNILPGFNRLQSEIVDMIGTDDADRLWAMSVEGLNLLSRQIKKHNLDCDLTHGHLTVATKPRHMTRLATKLAECRHHGYDHVSLLNAEEARRIVGSESVIGGLLNKRGGHVHALNLVTGLARIATGAGVRIFESTTAIRIDTGTMPWVRTDRDHLIRCNYICLAGNAYLDRLMPRMTRRMVPVSSAMIATEPLSNELARTVLSERIGVWDSNYVINSWRLTPDNRLIFGGGDSVICTKHARQCQSLHRSMLRYFPQLAETKLSHFWNGKVALTDNRLPHFGRLGPYAYFAQGYSGLGLVLGTIAGKLMADAITGKATERFDVFDRIPHVPFTGGPALAIPVLAGTILWHRLRDRL
ncbi:MAG: FAD-binding oxidoreductase [Pseudomonadota bacterium]|nr:FAD-binding oxidoreductase [Pseudomonadota bacterium]